MMLPWMALLSSRKFWVGLLTVAGTVGVVVLRAMDKIPADALVPTIGAVTATGLTIIGSIAWEDSASKGAGGKGATTPTPAVENAVSVNVAQPSTIPDVDPPTM